MQNGQDASETIGVLNSVVSQATLETQGSPIPIYDSSSRPLVFVQFLIISGGRLTRYKDHALNPQAAKVCKKE